LNQHLWRKTWKFVLAEIGREWLVEPWYKITYLFWRGFKMSEEVKQDEAVVNNPVPVEGAAEATVTATPPEAEDGKEKKPYRSPTSNRSRWDSTWYGANPHYLQPDHMTREERFPLIFDSAKKLKPNAKRVLSFGCSTGEECQSLAKRFPDAEVIGLEIDHYSIQNARKKNKNPKIFFHDEIGGTGKYDLVTALMVFFCMEEAIPRDRMVQNLQKIDEHLNEGGVVMLYTCDHDPTEILGPGYEPLNVWIREHNKNSKTYWNGYYRKRGGTTTIVEEKLDIDQSTMPANDYGNH
jgi:SAM-dependent methyltransferase